MNNSGIIAKRAVTTSIARMVCRGITAKRSAASGAETMARAPLRVWFNPWIRVNYSSGTMSDVDAVIAVGKNLPALELIDNKATRIIDFLATV